MRIFQLPMNKSNRFLGGGSDPFFRGRPYGEETAREIDCAVKSLVSKAFDTAVELLRKNQALLVESAEHPLKQETLELPSDPLCGCLKKSKARQGAKQPADSAFIAR